MRFPASRRSRFRPVRTVIAAVAAAGLLAAAAPGAAHADPATPKGKATAWPVLPRAGAHALEMPIPADVVATADHVFVSGGYRSEEIAVTNADGTGRTVLDGLPGPTDLLVSRDRRTLYVALPNVNAIAAYDTITLAQKAYHQTGGGTCPRHLTESDNTLWFGYACDDQNWGGNIGRINLSTGAVTTGLVADVFHGAPLLDVPAGSSAALITGQPGLSPASLRVYAIGVDGTLTFVRRSEHTALGSNLIDIAVRADLTSVFTACGWPYSIVSYGVPELTQQMSLPTTAYPNAVELSPDNNLIAGGSDAIYDPDVFVFRANGTKVGSVDFGRGATLIDQGLAWSPDGTRIYAVSMSESGPRPTPATLHVIPISR
jgi:hypothetical protein